MAERLKAGRRRTWLAALAATMALALLASGAVHFRPGVLPDAQASGGVVYKQGVVASRATVLGENGEPVFAEFDQSGAVVNVLGEAVDELADAVVMSGENYRAIARAFNDYLAANQEGVARGARVMTREEYEGTDFGGIDVPRPNDGGTESVRIPKPTLHPAVKSVLVRARETIIDPGLLPPDRGPVLLEAPIDLREGYLQELDEGIRSVLVNAQGQVVRASENNIGYRTAWVKPDNGPGDPTQDNRFFLAPGDQLWGPVSGARVEGGISNFTGYTDESGRFRLPMFIPPCPGFSFTYDYNIFARLNYRNFNPEAPRPVGFYYFSAPTYDICVGYGEVPLGYTLGALMTQISLQGLSASLNLSGSQRLIKIPVDLLVFTGDATLSNDGVTPLPVMGETRYEATPPPPMPFAPQDLDLDLDRNTDWTVLQGDVVDVFLGGRYPANEAPPYVDEAGNPIGPDLQRLPDYEPDFEDRGLLRTISQQDLKETDIYVYRVSTGQLVVERQGLSPNQILEQDGRFYYRILLPGPRAGYARVSRVTDVTGWQAQAGLNEELRGFQADFLRAGEQVKLIAINRPTGYIGTVTATIESPGAGRFDFPIDRLVLRPPQLKIKAERLYTVEAGLTQGEDRKYTIGSEGTGLTTDTYVAVYSEWTDHDGTPLPEELEGYTGRLAKVTGPNTLEGGDVAFFEIKPGTQLQLVQLAGDVLGSEHFYVHVSGYPRWRNPDFSETGAGTGPLEYRPSHYVPVRVPILDEKATRALRTTARYLEEDGQEVPGEIDALYRWPYRPEMQFSMLELKVKAIEREDLEGEISEILQASVDDDPETVAGIAADDQSVEILYDLFQQSFQEGGEQYSGLPSFGRPREMVFAVGEDEQRAAFGEDSSLTFANLAHLDELRPEDFLTVRLYQASDPENVLWEFALAPRLDGSPDVAEISADDPQLEVVAYLPSDVYEQINARDADQPTIIEVEWKVEGPDGYLDRSRSLSSLGIFSNVLHTSRTAGSTYTITARIVRVGGVAEGSLPLELGPFEVVPGLADRITLETDAVLVPADQSTPVTVTAVIEDAHGNLVADGTPVTWRPEDDGDFLYDDEGLPIADSSTTDGSASATIVPGFTLGTLPVAVIVDDVSQTIDIDKVAVEATVTADTELIEVGGQATATLTATFSSSAGPIPDGTPVDWINTWGELVAQTSVTDGQATAILRSANEPGDSTVIVSLAGARASTVVRHRSSQGISAYLDYLTIVGDPTGDGTVPVEQYDGSFANHPYITSTQLIIEGGSPGESVTVGLGTLDLPNSEPLRRFDMDSLYPVDPQNPGPGAFFGATQATNSIDPFGNQIAYANAGVSVAGDPTRPLSGPSFIFDGTGKIQIPASPELAVLDDLLIRVDFKPEVLPATESTLLTKGDAETHGYALKLVPGDQGAHLQAVVATDTGTVEITSTNPVQVGTWYRAGLELKGTELTLRLNGERIRVPVSGNLLDPGADLVAGLGYKGRLDNLRLYDESAQRRLLGFANGQPTQTVQFDAGGRATATVTASTTLAGFATTVGFTYAGGGSIAEAERKDLKITKPPVPDIFTRLGIFRAAYAQEGDIFGETVDSGGVNVVDRDFWGDLWDSVSKVGVEFQDYAKKVAQVADILLGFSDIYVIIKEATKLLTGRGEEVDYVDLGFSVFGLTLTIVEKFPAATPVAVPLNRLLRLFRPVIKALNKIGDIPIIRKLSFTLVEGTVRLFKGGIGRIVDLGRHRLGALFEARTYDAVALTFRKLGNIFRFLTDLDGQLLGLIGRSINNGSDFVAFTRAAHVINRACDIAYAPAPDPKTLLAISEPTNLQTRAVTALRLLLDFLVEPAWAACGDRMKALVQASREIGGELAEDALNDVYHLVGALEESLPEIADLSDEALRGALHVSVVRLGEGVTAKERANGLARLDAMFKSLLEGAENAAEAKAVLERSLKTVAHLAERDPAITGVERVMKQLASKNKNDVRGALHVLSDVEARAVDINAIKSFELPEPIRFVDANSNTQELVRRYDVELTDGSVLEYKAWEAGQISWAKSIREEFAKDVANLRTRQFQWVIHQNAGQEGIEKLAFPMICCLGLSGLPESQRALLLREIRRFGIRRDCGRDALISAAVRAGRLNEAEILELVEDLADPIERSGLIRLGIISATE